MEILSHTSTADSSSFEAFDAKVSMHEFRTSKAIDDDVKVGCVLKEMVDESLMVLQSVVRGEVMDVVQARAATGSSPMLVDTKGKGKGKGGKGESKDPKSKDDKGKGKGWKNKAKDKGAKRQDSKDSARKKCFYCDRTDSVQKTGARRRPQDDLSRTSKKVTALQTTDEMPPVPSVTVAPDFDGYLFAITMDCSWSDTLCLLADRLGVCSHGLPARLVSERPQRVGHRALWRERCAIQHCGAQEHGFQSPSVHCSIPDCVCLTFDPSRQQTGSETMRRHSSDSQKKEHKIWI